MQFNQVLHFYQVAKTITKIQNCDLSDFEKEVQVQFGDTVKVNVSDEYLEEFEGFRICPVSAMNGINLHLNVGMTKRNGKISVFRAFVTVGHEVLLDPQTFSKVIHVSHNDLDGESPLILSRIAFSECELITSGCSHDKIDEIVMGLIETEMNKENTIMFITDISVEPENLSKIHALVEEGYRIFIIDHHDAKEGVPVEKYSAWMSIDITYPDGRGTAATSMYYEFLVNHRLLKSTPLIDDYVELVRLYDTWEWDDRDNLRAKRLNDYFFMGNREEFGQQVFDRLTDVASSALFQFEEKIEYMLDMEQKRIDEYCKKKKKQIQLFKGLVDGSDRPYTYGVVFADIYQSELGNYLCKEFIQDMDFVVMLDPGGNKMSLRCSKHKDVDVGAIARSLGGGGRSATAGCPLTMKTKYLFLDQYLTKSMA